MQEIYRGEAPNDKKGTPARTGAEIINNNFKILSEAVVLLRNPDVVLKTADITINNLELSVVENGFSWRINNAEFASNSAFSVSLLAASDGYYRIDALLGTDLGGYAIFKGVESDSNVSAPTVFPDGTIFLGYIYLFGSNTLGSTIALAIRNPYTTFKPIQKGYGNTNLEIDEIGDLFCGWSNDGTIRISEGKWLGGSLADSNNFKPLVQIEL